jgi:hypothetical protein
VVDRGTAGLDLTPHGSEGSALERLDGAAALAHGRRHLLDREVGEDPE